MVGRLNRLARSGRAASSAGATICRAQVAYGTCYLAGSDRVAAQAEGERLALGALRMRPCRLVLGPARRPEAGRTCGWPPAAATSASSAAARQDLIAQLRLQAGLEADTGRWPACAGTGEPRDSSSRAGCFVRPPQAGVRDPHAMVPRLLSPQRGPVESAPPGTGPLRRCSAATMSDSEDDELARMRAQRASRVGLSATDLVRAAITSCCHMASASSAERPAWAQKARARKAAGPELDPPEPE